MDPSLRSKILIGVVVMVVAFVVLWLYRASIPPPAPDDPLGRTMAEIAQLDDLEDEQQVDRLRRYARHRDPTIAYAAIRHVTRQRTDRARGLLRQIARSRDTPAKARGVAVAEMARFERTSVRELLTYTADTEPAVVAGACEGLLRVAERDRESVEVAIPRLVRLLRSDDEQVRLWAISTLQKVVGVNWLEYDSRKDPLYNEQIIRHIERMLLR